jgi:hypothetical protein
MADDERPDQGPHRRPGDGGDPAPPGPPGGPGGTVDRPAGRRPVPPARPGEPEIVRPYELYATPVPPTASRRFTAWWARPSTIIIVMLAVFVLLISTTVFATLAISGGDGAPPPTASPSPTPSPSPTIDRPTELPTPPGGIGRSTEPAAPPTAGTPAAPGTGLPAPPADRVGVRLQSGAHEARYPSPDNGFDFDANDDTHAGGGGSTDVAITDFGLTGVNGVGLTRYPGRGRPQAHHCFSIPAEAWVLDAPSRELKAGVTLCFYTTEGRYGYLTVQAAGHTNAGLLDYLTFNFLVWEGPND